MRLSRQTIETLAPFVPAEDLRTMRIIVGAPWRWLPTAIGMAALTFQHWVIFRAGYYRPDHPLGLALIAHEAYHLTQQRTMGRAWFVARYFVGQLQCGFHHDRHPLERPAIDLQHRVAAAMAARPPAPPDPA